MTRGGGAGCDPVKQVAVKSETTEGGGRLRGALGLGFALLTISSLVQLFILYYLQTPAHCVQLLYHKHFGAST